MDCTGLGKIHVGNSTHNSCTVMLSAQSSRRVVKSVLWPRTMVIGGRSCTQEEDEALKISRSSRLISNGSRKPCWSFRGSFPEMFFTALTATCRGGASMFQWGWSTGKSHPTIFKHLAKNQVLTTKSSLHIPLGSRRQSSLTLLFIWISHVLVFSFCRFVIAPCVWFDIIIIIIFADYMHFL